MNSNERKQRTRSLIELGGIVSIAGLNQLDKGELLSLLIKSKRVYEKLCPEAKKSMSIIGWKIMKSRKEAKKS